MELCPPSTPSTRASTVACTGFRRTKLRCDEGWTVGSMESCHLPISSGDAALTMGAHDARHTLCRHRSKQYWDQCLFTFKTLLPARQHQEHHGFPMQFSPLQETFDSAFVFYKNLDVLSPSRGFVTESFGLCEYSHTWIWSPLTQHCICKTTKTPSIKASTTHIFDPTSRWVPPLGQARKRRRATPSTST